MRDKILFVDDEPAILSAHRRTVGRRFLVETAVGPRHALEKLRDSGPYALVVSDMSMPEMNGLELFARVRTVDPRAVGVVLTGNANVASAAEAVRAGRIFRYLEKPCEPEALVETLEAALRLYRDRASGGAPGAGPSRG